MLGYRVFEIYLHYYYYYYYYFIMIQVRISKDSYCNRQVFYSIHPLFFTDL